MARFRRLHNLRCFYCNRLSGIQYTRQSEFLCPHCDATNYLDENGEITDPPVATTTASQSHAYAFQRSVTPQSPESAQDIFCAKCLKNQHLYTASLAQYFPDDPDHPDYAALEKKYYKFRQDLEERYPQMCADCEPKVLAKLNAAGYIAKTDFLRTAMERSRANRTSPRRRTMMFLTDSLGRWLWYGAFVCQLLWHLSATADLLTSDLPAEAQGRYLVRAWNFTSRFLPSTESLIRLSLQMTVLGIWWNPKFPEIVRGFSRPILGLPKWYAFQAILAVARYLFPKIVQLDVERAEQANAQLAIHAFVAGLVSYVYVLARKSVRLDTTPLFASAEMTTLRPKITRTRAKKDKTSTTTQNLSDVLDDILNTPSRVTGKITRLDSPSSAGELPPSPQLSPFSPRTPPRKPVQPTYSEEMDWTPTSLPAPALRGPGITKAQPFGAPPSRADKPQRAFWAKLPPAPKAPAQRLVNPAPPATQTIKQDREIFTARFGGSSMLGSKKKSSSSGNHVDFAPPSFFSNENTSADPRSSLADMLGSSFSLSQEEDAANAGSSPNSASRKSGGKFTRTGVSGASPRRGPRGTDAAFLVVLIGLWLYAAQNLDEHSMQIMRASLGMSALLTLFLSKDAILRLAGGTSFGNIVGFLLCLAEIGAVGHLSLKLWTSSVLCTGCFEEGLWTIVVMLGHRLWDALG